MNRRPMEGGEAPWKLDSAMRMRAARRAARRITHEALQRCDAPARKAGAREIERKAAEEIPPTPFFERRTN